MEHKIKSPLVIGTCLSTLYQLSKCCFSCQVDFLDALFSSYYSARCAVSGYDRPYAQSTVSHVLTGKSHLPRHHLVYYISWVSNDYLYIDVSNYCAKVVMTQAQRETHYHALWSLASSASNLTAQDKARILSGTTSDTVDQLDVLLYRMLHILIRLPHNAA